MNIRGKEDPYLKIGETNDRSTKGSSDYVWALKDIDIKVEQGDVVGIIGKNGAGKSTLLKLLSKVTGPTTGSIKARGRIGALLEVGTGFHPEMTGRENIFLNGAILGMSKHEIAAKLDEIVDFSGCERYLDTPVKRYSSGMMVRLGFAVAAHLDPEILVVDEVLAVGDAEFQKKAIGKMQDVSKGEGRTVLFVSHNMASVRKLCKTGLVLDNGEIMFTGTANDAVDNYSGNLSKASLKHIIFVDNTMRDMSRSLDVKFVSFKFNKETCEFASDEDISLIIEIESFKDVPNCRVNYTIFSIDSAPISNHSSDHCFQILKGQKKKIRFTIINPGLSVGYYSVSFSVGTGNMTTGETNFDVVSNIIQFSINKVSINGNDYYVKWDKGWGNILGKAEVEEII